MVVTVQLAFHQSLWLKWMFLEVSPHTSGPKNLLGDECFMGHGFGCFCGCAVVKRLPISGYKNGDNRCAIREKQQRAARPHLTHPVTAWVIHMFLDVQRQHWATCKSNFCINYISNLTMKQKTRANKRKTLQSEIYNFNWICWFVHLGAHMYVCVLRQVRESGLCHCAVLTFKSLLRLSQCWFKANIWA